MIKTKICISYILLINYCEEEVYFYENLKEMLKQWNCHSIKEVLEYHTSSWNSVCIYDVKRGIKYEL